MTTVKPHQRVSKKGKIHSVREHNRKSGFYGNKWILTKDQFEGVRNKVKGKEAWEKYFGSYPVYGTKKDEEWATSKLIDYAKELGFQRVNTSDDGSFIAEYVPFTGGSSLTVRRDFMFDEKIPEIEISWSSGGGGGSRGNFSQVSETVKRLNNAMKLYKMLGGK